MSSSRRRAVSRSSTDARYTADPDDLKQPVSTFLNRLTVENKGPTNFHTSMTTHLLSAVATPGGQSFDDEGSNGCRNVNRNQKQYIQRLYIEEFFYNLHCQRRSNSYCNLFTNYSTAITKVVEADIAKMLLQKCIPITELLQQNTTVHYVQFTEYTRIFARTRTAVHVPVLIFEKNN